MSIRTLDTRDDFRPDDGLYFLPLGGCGEFGVNLNLYGHKGRWLLVDCGIGFGDERHPGIDILLPDPGFIEHQAGLLTGMIITHAHEDHVGAVARLWPRLGCPVYGTRFTLTVLRNKLREMGLTEGPRKGEIELIEIAPGDAVSLGPFDCRFFHVDHSVPETVALAIETEHGCVLHTADWKVDPAPIHGLGTDEAGFRALGESGVLALIGDSTNAEEGGESGGEQAVRDSLAELFGQFDGRIAVSCFSSNVTRIESIAQAARANGREVALVGRSLWTMTEAARACGYLADMPAFLSESEAGYVPADRICLICTGSQGESRAALAKIAADAHPEITLEEGDVAIFSARTIPGNEKQVQAVQNGLLKRGVKIITDRDAFVHVSGHANHDEMVRMYQWTRPQIAIPVHGEVANLYAHGEIARHCQVPSVIVPEDGTLIRLDGKKPGAVAEISTGLLAMDGERLIPLDGQGPVRRRKRMMYEGVAICSLVVDADGMPLADPKLITLGLVDDLPEADMIAEMVEEIAGNVEDLPRPRRRDDEEIQLAARKVMRRRFRRALGKRPIIEIEITRLDR